MFPGNRMLKQKINRGQIRGMKVDQLKEVLEILRAEPRPTVRVMSLLRLAESRLHGLGGDISKPKKKKELAETPPVVVEAEEEEEIVEMTKEEMKAELDELGIEYDGRWSAEKLAELLNESEE